MDCFDAKTEVEAWNAALEEHGKCIQKIRITHSNRTRTEFWHSIRRENGGGFKSMVNR